MQVVLSLSNEITRSPSTPNYFEMTTAEQQGIHYIYHNAVLDAADFRVLRALKFKSGIYINEAGLRFAILALSALKRGNYGLSENYRSQFRSAMKDIGRSNITVDNVIAFKFILSATPIERPDESKRYLREVSQVIDDIRVGRVDLDFSSLGIETDMALHAFSAFWRAVAVTDLDDRATSTFESFKYTLPKLCNMYENMEIGYGHEIDGILMYMMELRYDLRDAFRRYLRSKLISGEQVVEAVTPMLSKLQERLRSLEEFPLFLDMLEMDVFMSRRARSAGSVDGPSYQGIVYAGSDIDTDLRPYSITHAINLKGELIELPSPKATIDEHKSFFKMALGLYRRRIYREHLQNLILLNLMETAVHGYSTRDGADLAIKLTIIAFELQGLMVPWDLNILLSSWSLAELQMWRLQRPEGKTRTHK